MCRRYKIEPEDLRKFETYRGYQKDFPTEITEGRLAPALVLKGKDYVLQALSFGMDIVDRKVLNARLETIDEKEFFASSFEKRRCVLICSLFYETDKDGIERTFKGKGILYIARIYKSGSFVLLTTKPDESVAFYHKRMPLLLDRSAVRLYLSGQVGKREIESFPKVETISLDSSDQLSLF